MYININNTFIVIMNEGELRLRIAELEHQVRILHNQLREANGYLKMYEVKENKVMFKSKL